jgi:Domain of unknown function (DUF1841)
VAATALDEKSLRSLTLSSWAAKVWEKELRGQPLVNQEAALAWCMRLHGEWRNFWDRLNHPRSGDPLRSTSVLVHIYNDAAVKFQLDTKNPPEIVNLFQTMQDSGFKEIDAMHAIAFAMQEQTWHARDTNSDFNMKQYIERAKAHVENVLQDPRGVHSLRCP